MSGGFVIVDLCNEMIFINLVEKSLVREKGCNWLALWLEYKGI